MKISIESKLHTILCTQQNRRIVKYFSLNILNPNGLDNVDAYIEYTYCIYCV